MQDSIGYNAMQNYLCVGSATYVCVWLVTRYVMERNKTTPASKPQRINNGLVNHNFVKP